MKEGQAAGALGTDPATSIVEALSTGNKSELAAAVRQALISSVGLRPEHAVQVMALLGHRPVPRVDHHSLYMIADAAIQNAARPGGKPPRGIKKRVCGWCASIWERESGQPGHGAEEFRKAYDAWVNRGRPLKSSKEELEAYGRVRRQKASFMIRRMNERTRSFAK